MRNNSNNNNNKNNNKNDDINDGNVINSLEGINSDKNFGENKSNNEASNGNKFTIDYSKRGTAKCRKCKKSIPKDILRIGKNAMFKEKHIIQYYHITCVFETFKNAKLASKTLTNINELDGVENITEDERILIGNCIEEGNKTRADSIPRISALTSIKTAKLQRVTGARKATLKITQ